MLASFIPLGGELCAENTHAYCPPNTDSACKRRPAPLLPPVLVSFCGQHQEAHLSADKDTFTNNSVIVIKVNVLFS